MGHIFISYSHKNSSYVHKLAEALEQEGFEVWIDDRIHYGSEWPKVVTRNLDASDGVIVVLSNNSYESDMVQNEVTRARDKKKTIFPLLLEGENWLIVQAKQFVDVKDGSLPTEKFYKRLEEITPRKKGERETKEKPSSEPKQRISFLNARNKFVSIPIKNTLSLLFVLLVIVGTFYILVVYIPKYNPIIALTPTHSPTPSSQPNLTSTETFASTEISTSSQTPTKFFTPTTILTLTPYIGSLSTETAVVGDDSMVLVPASEFIMGSDNADPDEQPVHQVFLDTYYIDKYEVTNALYKACVESGACKLPSKTEKYNSSYYAQHPVVFVDWNMATAYCEWRGARLPTEAEWEKAARGSDGRTFPWGEKVDNTYANFGNDIGDTTTVGAYPKGVSPYGAYDMAGNVEEWVADWYDENYYENSPLSNPIGPDYTGARLVRGGAWWQGAGDSRSADRTLTYFASLKTDEVGFRCARDANP